MKIEKNVFERNEKIVFTVEMHAYIEQKRDKEEQREVIILGKIKAQVSIFARRCKITLLNETKGLWRISPWSKQSVSEPVQPIIQVLAPQ